MRGVPGERVLLHGPPEFKTLGFKLFRWYVIFLLIFVITLQDMDVLEASI